MAQDNRKLGADAQKKQEGEIGNPLLAYGPGGLSYVDLALRNFATGVNNPALVDGIAQPQNQNTLVPVSQAGPVPKPLPQSADYGGAIAALPGLEAQAESIAAIPSGSVSEVAQMRTLAAPSFDKERKSLAEAAPDKKAYVGDEVTRQDRVLSAISAGLLGAAQGKTWNQTFALGIGSGIAGVQALDDRTYDRELQYEEMRQQHALNEHEQAAIERRALAEVDRLNRQGDYVNATNLQNFVTSRRRDLERKQQNLLTARQGLLDDKLRYEEMQAGGMNARNAVRYDNAVAKQEFERPRILGEVGDTVQVMTRDADGFPSITKMPVNDTGRAMLARANAARQGQGLEQQAAAEADVTYKSYEAQGNTLAVKRKLVGDILDLGMDSGNLHEMFDRPGWWKFNNFYKKALGHAKERVKQYYPEAPPEVQEQVMMESVRDYLAAELNAVDLEQINLQMDIPQIKAGVDTLQRMSQ